MILMAFNNIWIFILIAIYTPSNLAAEPPKEVTPTEQVKPSKFMASGVTFLKFTTMGVSGVTCIKAQTTWITANRTFIQRVRVKSDGKWSKKYLNYRPIWKTKNPLLLQGFAFENQSTGDNMTHIFNYTTKYCAVIYTQTKNVTGGVESEAWELWMNYAYFKENRNHEDFCKTTYTSICNCENTTKEYNMDDCEDYKYKQKLVK
ncbi:hypothetical protein MRX96_047795 [Rhipicephalus microplus]